MKKPFSGWMKKAWSRGEAYTALDAMKMFAIINMTADHIGYYLFPEDLWWRAIGRITFPVWFFLVGYSRARSLGAMLWVYAILLIVDNPFVSRSIFPVNALVTIIICRLVLNACEDYKLLPTRLPELIVAFGFLSFFTMPFFEYGSIAFLYALLGRMVYQKQKKHLLSLAISSYVLFIAWQFVFFSFNILQWVYVIVGTGWVVAWLVRSPNNVIWPDWTHSWWKTCITVLSRNTLPYYFYHRVLLEILSAFILGKGFGFALRLF